MNCLGCGQELTKRHQKMFCSNHCQRAAERAANVEKWLRTGVGTTGSGRGHYMRLHIFSEQDGKCAICGGVAMWQGLELRLILDHVDGDSSNNSRTNLRLVCPNCDSQLPIYKARNRGRGRAWRRRRYAEGSSY